MKQLRIVITIDVDMQDYLADSDLDEFEICFPLLRQALQNHPEVKTTWFLRIDSQVAARYGNYEYFLHRHNSKLNWLQSHGHEVGWHHHAYYYDGVTWAQETNEETVLEQIHQYGEVARNNGMMSARMGWGCQTVKSMRVLDELGFIADSSAIPRPCYPWDLHLKDWSRCPEKPYHPSVYDYQKPGEPSLQILEVPMTTSFIPAPGDNVQMKRYINLAYHPQIFNETFQSIFGKKLIVTVTHPYELLPNKMNHALLAFSSEAFARNLKMLANLDANFLTVTEIARSWLNAG